MILFSGMTRSDSNRPVRGTISLWVLALFSLLLVPAYDSYLLSPLRMPAYLIAMLPVLVFFTLCLLLSGRLVFSTLLTHAAFLLLVYGNSIKYQALTAPVMFEDLFFFQNPVSAYGLFSEYVGMRASKVVLVLIVLGLLLGLVWHERRRIRLLPRLLVLAATLLVAQQLVSSSAVSAGYRQLGVEDKIWNQSSNLKQNGLYTVFTLSAVNTGRSLPPIDADIAARLQHNRNGVVLPQASVRPDIIYYLSESLFDPGIMSAYQSCEIFQLLCRLGDAAQLGVFDVPTYGGGTTRTEFAVLTGADPERFEHQLHIPYSKVMYRQVNSMAWEMRSRGYRTIVIHPNHAEFYNRNVAMPNLGFDEFISLKHFPQTKHKNATYTDDAELNKKIIASIADSDQPVFILAISIENHGPWGQRKIRDRAELNRIRVPADLPGDQQQQLREYLFHVRYAAAALQELSDYVLGSDDPMVLFFFGDHLPSLNKVFANTEFDNGKPARQQDSFFVYLKNYAPPQLPARLAAHQTTPAILHELKLLRPNQFYDLYQLNFGWDDRFWNRPREQLIRQAQLQQMHWQPPP